MPSEIAAPRSLFVDHLLVEAEPTNPELTATYNEAQDLTVLPDGTPLVEAANRAGTHTLTKNTGERDDNDEHSLSSIALGTMTSTAVTGERHDVDAPVAWGSTQVNTRRFPADVEQD